jgi:hypothetical protein
MLAEKYTSDYVSSESIYRQCCSVITETRRAHYIRYLRFYYKEARNKRVIGTQG